ncbi:hypothetical protein [Bacteroides caecimuris]|jgi:hypothetical protein|uniref:hypothetical protein n=1 Tax=Bacteroides caecimuris TaxID=1796613 RepID=UPI00256FE53C|nr:hypothetical protein [Bacteroides caecimuris]
MELKLNVYENKGGKRIVKKEYVTDTLFISFGIVEDILAKIDFKESGDTTEQAIKKSLPFVKPILKEIFVGLTDKELRTCNTVDLIVVAKQIIQYCIELLYGVSDEKNVKREA